MSNQRDLGFSKPQDNNGPVECLGLTFESDDARRAHFLARLREKLQDPEFRQTPGFPKGSDEDILRMSDPPFYTACPNPFIEDFARVHGKAYDPSEHYEREPFAVDVSVGKTDQLYKAHGYHTKVPHLAIVPSILHYTRPGDLVLDGFCGSGMTGLAAQWCGTAVASYRQQLEAEWNIAGHTKPEWGARKVVLNDLGPAASFIAAGFNLPFDVKRFEKEARRILREVENELGWMFECRHTDGKTKGRINYTVWSEVFSCPECAGEVNFMEVALEEGGAKASSYFLCPHCDAELTKRRLEQLREAVFDRALGHSVSVPKRVPTLINYMIGRAAFDKKPEASDLELLDRVARMPLPAEVPTDRMMDAPEDQGPWGDKWRAGTASFRNVHHLFMHRTAITLGTLWKKASAVGDVAISRALRFLLDSHIINLSNLNRFRPHVSFPYNPLGGVYYVSSMVSEADWLKAYQNKLRRILSAFGAAPPGRLGNAIVGTGDCAQLAIPDNSIDYVFTDPPFGANFAYAELNFVVEAWHGVKTAIEREAIESPFQGKGTHDYQVLMQDCFRSYYRVLKPGRWMTVVFSNNSNAIWRAIQEAMGAAGFIVADVRTLDKKQGTFNQVAGHTVKQDLVISAYKPAEALTHHFELGHATFEGAWSFIKEHLRNVPVFVGRASGGEVVAERTAQMLLDRMIAFHVQRGLSVPLSATEFLQGLSQRFPERDGMYFLPDQVAEYDRRRTSVSELRQLSLFVNDEASAIQWVRQQLQDKPQSFQDLQPQFMRELQAWAKHEKAIELKIILEQSFLCYDGRGQVPTQIHRYLSTNYKELRNLSKDAPRLIEKARDRWYVPDPNKQAEREAIREKSLLREFEEYKSSTQRKLKVFRTEAMRVGFKACWQERDYGTIVKVAEKLPDAVLQEDEKLLMYYDNALTRLGDE